MAAPIITDQGFEADTNPPLHERRKRWTIGLLISAALGAVSGLAGLVVGALSLFGMFTDGISGFGTVAIVAALPLFVFAAHCLDKIGAVEKALRVGNCGSDGVKDNQ